MIFASANFFAVKIMEKVVIKKNVHEEKKVKTKDEKESLVANMFRYHFSSNVNA